jgi:hypothetical protein
MHDSEDKLGRFLKLLKENRLDHSAREFGFETRLMSRIRDQKQNSASLLAWKLMPYLVGGNATLVILLCQMTANDLSAKTSSLFADSSIDCHDDLLEQQ